jgi:hypothetical protein
MKSDLETILNRVTILAHQLFPSENKEMEILDIISDELIKEIKSDEIKKALINMFLVGQICGERKQK